MEGGRKSKGVSQARKRRGFTVYATGGASMEEDRNSLNFLLLNNKKERTFSLKGNRLGACCLTILILLILLNVLRVRCDHATPTFPELKV